MTREEAIKLLQMYEIDEYGEAWLHTWYNGIDKDMHEAMNMAISALSAERVVRCEDCEYRVHCHQTVSHTKIHEDFKEYWAEPIDFCSKAKMKGDI